MSEPFPSTAESQQRNTLLTQLDPLFDELKAKGMTDVNVTVSGVVGNGKSAVLDNLAQFLVPQDKPYFVSRASTSGVTGGPEPRLVVYRGLRFHFTDQAGLLDATTGKDVESLHEQVMQNSDVNHGGYHTVLFCQSVTNRLNQADEAIVYVALRCLGEEVAKHAIGVLTKGDGLSNITDETNMLNQYTASFSKLFGAQIPCLVVTNATRISTGDRVAMTPSHKDRYKSAFELWNLIVKLAKQKPFKPKQVQTEVIQQHIQDAQKKFILSEEDWKKVFQAITTVLPVLYTAGGGCTIL